MTQKKPRIQLLSILVIIKCKTKEKNQNPHVELKNLQLLSIKKHLKFLPVSQVHN